jgi:antitoxin (DNA-binding transcriptional repressor) of toxin-antitoxin stability system
MRALDRGDEFVITRNGVPVGELRPIRRRFVSRAALQAVLAGAPPIDRDRFFADVDRVVSQDAEPRS